MPETPPLPQFTPPAAGNLSPGAASLAASLGVLGGQQSAAPQGPIMPGPGAAPGLPMEGPDLTEQDRAAMARIPVLRPGQTASSGSSVPTPTTLVTLPSKGRLYDGALGDGQITIRAWTSTDEAMLHNQGTDIMTKVTNLVNNTYMDHNRLPAEELLIADRLAILILGRAFSLDPEYEFEFTCSACRQQSTAQISIYDLDINYLGEDEEGNEIVGFAEPFSATLPQSKQAVQFRLLRGRDERDIYKVAKKMRVKTTDAADPSHFRRLALSLVNVDGKDLTGRVNEAERIVRGWTMKDSIAFQDAINEVETGISTELPIECARCGRDTTTELQLTFDFFRPSPRNRRQS